MQAEAALDAVERGFTAIKFDPAGPYTMRGGHQPGLWDIDLRCACAALREAVGNRADLLFGTHGQFTPSGAIRLGRALEPYQPLWYEEPIPPDNLLDFAQVAQAVRIPLATGERMTTKAEFGTLLRTGGAASCNRRWGVRAGSGRPRRSPPWPRPLARRSPRICMPGRWNGRRMCSLGASCPTCCWSNASGGGRIPSAADPPPVRVEGGFIRRRRRPDWALNSTRRWPAPTPMTATGCTCRCRRPADYVSGNAFEGGAPRD
jgi:galactonate dehydratase